jgi:hypothetical protein
MALKNFNPDKLLENWSEEKYSPTHTGKPFGQCIGEAFGLTPHDKYVYRAQAETTLLVTQRAIDAKRARGMHGWYHDDDNKPVCTPEIRQLFKHHKLEVLHPTYFMSRLALHQSSLNKEPSVQLR